MIKHAVILIALFGAAGAWVNVNALQNGSRQPESWLHEIVPTKIGEWELDRALGPDKPITYTMDEITYDELDPIGIAAQRFRFGSMEMDAVVIAGNQNESFHDQRWCFEAQGYELRETAMDTISTKVAGDIPVQLVQISKGGMPATYALFTFQGPTKFHATTFEMGRDYFVAGMSANSLQNGFFFRFIPLYPGATKDEVKAFASAYIDTAAEASKGILGEPKSANQR